MAEWQWALLWSALALGLLGAVWKGRRRRDARRDLRLVLACGAAVGGLALVLLSLRELP